MAKKIGFLGPKGTFTEFALETYAKRNALTIEKVAASSIFELFSLLANKSCDEIVIPIENSVEGFVSSSLDLLGNAKNTFIKEEIIIPINHALLAKEVVDIDKITHVMSHPQALAQCQNFINTHLKKAKISPTESTALAAELVEISPQVSPHFKKIRACIGNKELSTIYNLKVLQENVNDFENNRTRFLVLSHKEAPKTEASKTSIVFSTKQEKPGSLCEVLQIFSDNNINLTHISSRPSKSQLGNYMFFVDFIGHKKSDDIKKTLDKIKEKTDFIKILGSYKKEADA